MRYFFRRRQPAPNRVLLVESGSRHLLDALIPVLRRTLGERIPIDLVTCFPGAPGSLDPDSARVYRVEDYRARARRAALYRELASSGYSHLGIICSAEPVMLKWKWMLAWKVPAKVFVLNENGDYFWLDWGHWRIMQHFLLYRAGFSGAGAVRTAARVCFFPLALAYLVLYATTVHLRRSLRRG